MDKFKNNGQQYGKSNDSSFGRGNRSTNGESASFGTKAFFTLAFFLLQVAGITIIDRGYTTIYSRSGNQLIVELHGLSAFGVGVFSISLGWLLLSFATNEKLGIKLLIGGAAGMLGGLVVSIFGYYFWA